MTSSLTMYKLGQARSPAGWLVSDWSRFSPIMEWSAGDVWSDAGGVHLMLVEALAGSRELHRGGEIRSGAVFGVFAFQADDDDPRVAFDVEFVKGRADRA